MEKDFYYNEIVIQNKSSDIIRDVTIKVEKTGRIFRCSIIAPYGNCSNSFKKKKYHGNLAIVTWTNRNKKILTEEVQLSIPENFNHDKLIKGVLEINRNGEINPYLMQD
jgi:hypothetical protein